MTQRGRLLAALVAMAVATALLAGSLAVRKPLIERFLLWRITAAGIRTASLRVERAEWGRLSVGQVALGPPPAARVERVVVDWSLAALLGGRFDAVSLEGVILAGSVGADGLSLGPLDAALASPGAAGEPPALPTRRLTIRDLRAEFATPLGAATLRGGGDLEEDRTGHLTGTVRFDVEHRQLLATGTLRPAGTLEEPSAALRVSIQPRAVPGLRLEGPAVAELRIERSGGTLQGDAQLGAVRFHYQSETVRAAGETPRVQVHVSQGAERGAARAEIRAREGRLTLPDLGVEAGELMLDATWEDGRFGGSASLGRLQDTHREPRFVELVVKGEFGGDARALRFDGRVEDRRQQLSANLRASADLLEARGEAELRLAPLRFAPGQLQPAKLLPILGDRLEAVQGEVEARLQARRSEGETTLRTEVALRDLSLRTEWATVGGVSGTLEILGPDPLETAGEQLLGVALVDFGLPLVNGLVGFQLRPEGILELGRAEWEWAGGRLSTSASLDPRATEWEMVLDAEELDVSQLLAHVDLEGLAGEGRLSGRIPLVVRRDTVRVRDAGLEGAQGRIRYAPTAAVQALGASQPSKLGMALEALSDFRFDHLSLGFDGDARGEMDLRVDLRGRNPNFQAGRTVELHLNVEAHLADLVRARLEAYRVPQVIAERLRNFPKGKPMTPARPLEGGSP